MAFFNDVVFTVKSGSSKICTTRNLKSVTSTIIIFKSSFSCKHLIYSPCTYLLMNNMINTCYNIALLQCTSMHYNAQYFVCRFWKCCVPCVFAMV